MKRFLALAIGWLGTGTALYSSFLLLDVYWNIADWKPRWDRSALILVIGIVAALGGLGWLARVSRDRWTWALALVVCLALCLVSLHAFPPEPLVTGLFARESPSPLWYRGLRVTLMSLPIIFLALRRLRLPPKVHP